MDRTFGQRFSPLFILFIYLLVLEKRGDGSGARQQSGNRRCPRPWRVGHARDGGASGGAGGALRAAAEPGVVRAASPGRLLAGAQPARPLSDGRAAGPGAAPGSGARGAADGDGYFGTSQPTAGREMEAPLSEAPGGPEDVSRVSLPARTSWSHWKAWPPGRQRCHWDAWTCGGPRRCRHVHHRSPWPPWSAGHSRFSWISGSHWAGRQTGPPRTERGDGPDGSPRTAGTSRTKRRKGSVWRVPTPGAPKQLFCSSALQPDNYPEG